MGLRSGRRLSQSPRQAWFETIMANLRQFDNDLRVRRAARLASEGTGPLVRVVARGDQCHRDRRAHPGSCRCFDIIQGRMPRGFVMISHRRKTSGFTLIES